MEARNACPNRVVRLYLRSKNNKGSEKSSDKIRCFVGGEWKPRSEFSNRQLEKHDRMKNRPGGSEISCRVHSAQVRRELQCKGPCGKWQPIENYSKNTRVQGKEWCVDCTDWQLSVEPGYAPYMPPGSYEVVDDDHLLEEGHDDSPTREREPSERIEDWIQGNPSQLGDYDMLETATQRSAIGSSSIGGSTSVYGGGAGRGPVQTLLDSSINDFDGLPQALSAVNLGRAGYQEQLRPSYASAASDATLVREPLELVRRGDNRLPPPAVQNVNYNSGPTNGPELPFPSHHSSTVSTFLSMTTAVADNQAQSMTSRSSTAWMENEFSALAIAPPVLSQQPEASSAWAKPNQRRTEIVPPKYVMDNGGSDLVPQSIQATTYADTDDEGSDDEC